MLTLQVDDDYERLVDEDGDVIAEGHKLDAEDVLFGLRIPFEIEIVETGEES